MTTYRRAALALACATISSASAQEGLPGSGHQAATQILAQAIGGQPTSVPNTATHIGQWEIGSLPDGRPFAVGKSVDNAGYGIKELRVECVPGGRLEYVPVPAKPEPVRALWMGEEEQEELRLSNGRVVGSMAASVSKAFLTSEAYAKKNAPGRKFTVTLVLNQLSNMGSSIVGNGFSEMRRFVLDRCKS